MAVISTGVAVQRQSLSSRRRASCRLIPLIPRSPVPPACIVGCGVHRLPHRLHVAPDGPALRIEPPPAVVDLEQLGGRAVVEQELGQGRTEVLACILHHPVFAPDHTANGSHRRPAQRAVCRHPIDSLGSCKPVVERGRR